MYRVSSFPLVVSMNRDVNHWSNECVQRAFHVGDLIWIVFSSKELDTQCTVFLVSHEVSNHIRRYEMTMGNPRWGTVLIVLKIPLPRFRYCRRDSRLGQT